MLYALRSETNHAKVWHWSLSRIMLGSTGFVDTKIFINIFWIYKVVVVVGRCNYILNIFSSCSKLQDMQSAGVESGQPKAVRWYRYVGFLHLSSVQDVAQYIMYTWQHSKSNVIYNYWRVVGSREVMVVDSSKKTKLESDDGISHELP